MPADILIFLRRAACFAASCHSLIFPAQANPTEKFFGNWVGPEEHISCDTLNLGEGTDILIIEKKRFANSGVSCTEVNYWMVGDVMRYSVGCDGPEAGIELYLLELRMDAKGHLIHEGRSYRRCDPKRRRPIGWRWKSRPIPLLNKGPDFVK